MTDKHAQKQNEDEIENDEELVKSEPTWFSGTYGDATPEDLAARYIEKAPQQPPAPVVTGNAEAYAAYQKRIDERFAMAQRMADPYHAVQNNTLPPGASFPQRPRYGQPEQPVPVAKHSMFGVSPATLAILTLTACALGGAGGFGVANPDKISALANSGVAYASALWFAPAEAPKETVISKKVVRTAKLSVKDIAGAVNAPIALGITAQAADEENPVALRITGLPAEAYLTKGAKIAEGEWMLKAEDMAQAELIVPHTTTPEIALEVSALEANTGLPAAPSQDMNVTLDMKAVPVPGVPQPKVDDVRILPANAQADQGFNKQDVPLAVPLPIESLNPEVRGLITKGDTLLATGDVLAARQFYLKAFKLDAPEAAYGMGQTFDPSVYLKHKIKGLVADPQMAAEWYGKAAAAGYENASAALMQLPLQP